MRGLLFAKRIGKELLRDPLSYIFCLGTPLGMMLLFYVIYVNMPVEARAGMTVFRPDVLTPGIVFFGFSFVMLFGTLLLARDRTGAFLERLCATPMRTRDFFVGYALPLILLGLGQCVLTFCVGAVMGASVGTPLTFVGCLRSLLALLPSLLFFVGCGLTIGSVLSEMAAPGICSVLVTLAGVMGGVWMPLSDMPKLERIFSCFPFLHMVKLARLGMSGGGESLWLRLAVSVGSCILMCLLSLWAMTRALRREK